MLAVGTVVSEIFTVNARAEDVPIFPAASYAFAVQLWTPLSTIEIAQAKL